ncbi:MAG: prolyl oligopeptidase family serine peptidase [Luteitalea sp.]|nr:prolyl oligopeptidase family serine peptidase [Luteitalea sp.]
MRQPLKPFQFIATFCFVSVVSVVVLAEQRPMSAEDVLKIREVGDATMSPDGTRVLFTVRQPESSAQTPERKDMRSHVWLATVGCRADSARQITFGERGESAPQWSPDGRWISFVTSRGRAGSDDEDEGPKRQIWIMRADGGEASKLTDAKEDVGDYAWSKDSKRVAYLMRDPLPKEIEEKRKKRDDAEVFEDDFRRTHLWTIEVESQEATKITDGDAHTISSFDWAPDGTRVVFSAKPTPMVRDHRSDVAIVTIASKAVTQIASTTASETAPAWSPDGRTIGFLSRPYDVEPHPDGISILPLVNSRLSLYDVESGETKDVSSDAFDHDPSALIWSPDSQRILLNIGARAYREMFTYDVSANRYIQLTKGRVIAFGSFAEDGSKAAVTMSTPTKPGDVYVTDASMSTFEQLSDANSEVRELTLGETEVVTWKSDGIEIEGLLLKPANYQTGRRYPLLVEVHGGPTGAYTNGFKESGQMWAGQGWAVFYPNPRGSSNYGEQFMAANIDDWGGGDYRDIMSGVDGLVERGIADPERLAVMGWSYGGYMTCWIVSQTDRFKAAMMGAGLSNIYSMYGTTDIPGYLATFFQDMPTKDNLPLYRERSGLTYVDRVTTPLLILHGARDERVPIGQPMEIYRALEDRGKTVELVFYPREAHGLQEYYHRLDRLKRQYAWIAKYTLGEAPKPKPTPTSDGAQRYR